MEGVEKSGDVIMFKSVRLSSHSYAFAFGISI